jgi:DNA-binding FadR family transcriptional regulator
MSRINQVAHIAAQLERQILSGQLAPGDQLPSERDLSVQLGVSRNVVREALGQLVSLGLVRRVHGSGTHVEAPSGRAISVAYQRLLSRPDVRLEHLAEVRLPLETTIAALAAHKRTNEQLQRLRKTQEILGNPRRSLEAHIKADREFHAILGEATGNPFFQIVLAPIQQLLIESRRHTLGQYGAGLAHRHHGLILDAVAAGNAEAAAQAMREHIQANFEHLQEMSARPPV